MYRYILLVVLCLVGTTFADQPTCSFKGETSVKAWNLAQFEITFSELEGKSLPASTLFWKLFYQGKEQSDALLHRKTQGSHKNSFLPKNEGTFVLKVFSEDEKTLLLEKEVQVSAWHNVLERVSTLGPAFPDLGHVDWVETLADAKKIAFEQKKPMLLAFFTCCVASERPSKQIFKNEEFLSRANNFVVVPIMLGTNEKLTEALYLVRSGLSFVTVNADGIFIEYLFRPSLDEVLPMMDKALEENKKKLATAGELRQQVEKAKSDVYRGHALFQLGNFYKQGKAYDQAQICLEESLALLENSYDQKMKAYVTDILLDLYMNQAKADQVIQIVEKQEGERDYYLMCLGMAYYIKRETDSDKKAVLEKSKGYFTELLSKYPKSMYVSFSKGMLQKINSEN